MRFIKTASVALALGIAVAASTAPASAFFLHKSTKVAAATTKNPICGFFEAIFHHGK